MNPNFGLASQPLHSPQGLAYLFGPNGPFAESDEPQVDEIRLRHLKTPLEISQVMHLREELNLPTAIRDDPAFADREKKETKSALSVHLSGVQGSLEPSALFPSARVLPQAAPYFSATRLTPPKAAGRSDAWFSRRSTGQGPSC